LLKWALKLLSFAIYEDLARVPWNLEEPTRLLVEFVESGAISPCRAVDLGCGAGNYAVWLAAKGFQVTGLDLSTNALRHARRLADRAGVDCRFVPADLCGEVSGMDGDFDFAYDWEVLHYVFPEDRETYVRNVHRMLRPGARYLSVCFSESDGGFGGEGKFRKTTLGTTLYFSSADELRLLFEPLFDIDALSIERVEGKYEPHDVAKALLV
jgi:SAM-dependent methyltransferase